MSKEMKTGKKIKYVNEPADIYELGYCIGTNVCGPGLDGSAREGCCNK